MKKITLFFTTISITALLFSCSSDNNVTPYVSLQTSELKLEFDDTDIRSTSNLSFVITNNGNQNIENIIPTNDFYEFSITPSLPLYLTPGMSQNIVVNFNPSTNTDYQDKITFTSNSTKLLEVPLYGKGIPAFTLSGLSEEIELESATINEPINFSYGITNHGKIKLENINLYTNDPALIVYPSSFSIAPEETISIKVTFSATTIGKYENYISVYLGNDLKHKTTFMVKSIKAN